MDIIKFLRKLENELVVQKTICQLDNNLKTLKEFISDIKMIINEFENQLI